MTAVESALPEDRGSRRIPASAVEAHFYVACQVHPAPGLNMIVHAVRVRGLWSASVSVRACASSACGTRRCAVGSRPPAGASSASWTTPRRIPSRSARARRRTRSSRTSSTRCGGPFHRTRGPGVRCSSTTARATTPSCSRPTGASGTNARRRFWEPSCRLFMPMTLSLPVPTWSAWRPSLRRRHRPPRLPAGSRPR